MRFKTPIIKSEFDQLDSKNSALKAAALKVEEACDKLGLDEPFITCIFRDSTENAKVGGIANSPHCVWEGMDFRSTIYKPDEIQDILKEINSLYKYGIHPAMIYHKVDGNMWHLHLQIKRLALPVS